MKSVCDDYLGQGSSFQIFLTLVRYPLGIALFLLPWSMKFGGIIAGPILIAVFVIINAYRGHVLTKIAEDLTLKGIAAPSGISDWWVLENSMGGIRRTSVNCYLVIFSTIQWFSLLGHASTFLAFAGLSFRQVFQTSAGVDGDRVAIGICIVAVVIAHAFTQWLRNNIHGSCEDCICPCICSAFLLILLPALFAVFLGLPTIVSFTSRLASSNDALQQTTDAKWDKIFLLFAGVIFTTGATPDDVTASYENLRDRKKFPIILIVAAVVTIVVGIGVSVSVFLGLGLKTCGSITFNLPLNGGTYSIVRIASGTLALVFVSFRHQIDPALSERLSGAEILCDVAFKMIFLGVAGGLALGIPSYAGLACLFGSLTSFTLTFVFPFLSDLLLHVTGGRVAADDNEDLLHDEEGTSLTGEPSSRHQHQEPLSVLRIIRDVLFIAIGIAGLIAGMAYTSEFLRTELQQSALADCDHVPYNGTSIFSTV
ncbi:neutral amino acid uniporter 4-like [Styela clava]